MGERGATLLSGAVETHSPGFTSAPLISNEKPILQFFFGSVSEGPSTFLATVQSYFHEVQGLDSNQDLGLQRSNHYATAAPFCQLDKQHLWH